MEANAQIANLLAEAAKLSKRAADLAAKGKITEALELEKQGELLRRQAKASGRSIIRAQAAPLARERRGESMREVTISSLSEIGVPASPKAVADYALSRFGVEVESRLLASMRRDEQRAWSSPRTHRAVYIVPALEGGRFLPIRGKVALSDWALDRRIVGPWSERVDHLNATRNLARQLGWLMTADPTSGKRLTQLVASYAVTVPGAVSDINEIDPARIESAVNSELKVLEPRDIEWRADAAARARRILGEEQQAFGASTPSLVPGGE